MDGMISLGEAPAAWGFTVDRFCPGSYLWREGDRIIVSLIRAMEEGRGYFSRLVKAIEADGLKVAVPNPMSKMSAILRRWGFVPHLEEFSEAGAVLDVWSRP